MFELTDLHTQHTRTHTDLLPEQVIAFVKASLVPAATGGLYYQSEAGKVVNLVHLYFWLTLFVVPLSISLSLDGISRSAQIGYALVIAALYVLIQRVNTSLHQVFDHHEEGSAAAEAPAADPAAATAGEAGPAEAVRAAAAGARSAGQSQSDASVASSAAAAAVAAAPDSSATGADSAEDVSIQCPTCGLYIEDGVCAFCARFDDDGPRLHRTRGSRRPRRPSQARTSEEGGVIYQHLPPARPSGRHHYENVVPPYASSSELADTIIRREPVPRLEPQVEQPATSSDPPASELTALDYYVGRMTAADAVAYLERFGRPGSYILRLGFDGDFFLCIRDRLAGFKNLRVRDTGNTLRCGHRSYPSIGELIDDLETDLGSWCSQPLVALVVNNVRFGMQQPVDETSAAAASTTTAAAGDGATDRPVANADSDSSSSAAASDSPPPLPTPRAASQRSRSSRSSRSARQPSRFERSRMLGIRDRLSAFLPPGVDLPLPDGVESWDTCVPSRQTERELKNFCIEASLQYCTGMLDYFTEDTGAAAKAHASAYSQAIVQLVEGNLVEIATLPQKPPSPPPPPLAFDAAASPPASETSPTNNVSPSGSERARPPRPPSPSAVPSSSFPAPPSPSSSSSSTTTTTSSTSARALSSSSFPPSGGGALPVVGAVTASLSTLPADGPPSQARDRIELLDLSTLDELVSSHSSAVEQLVRSSDSEAGDDDDGDASDKAEVGAEGREAGRPPSAGEPSHTSPVPLLFGQAEPSTPPPLSGLEHAALPTTPDSPTPAEMMRQLAGEDPADSVQSDEPVLLEPISPIPGARRAAATDASSAADTGATTTTPTAAEQGNSPPHTTSGSRSGFVPGRGSGRGGFIPTATPGSSSSSSSPSSSSSSSSSSLSSSNPTAPDVGASAEAVLGAGNGHSPPDAVNSRGDQQAAVATLYDVLAAFGDDDAHDMFPVAPEVMSGSDEPGLVALAKEDIAAKTEKTDLEETTPEEATLEERSEAHAEENGTENGKDKEADVEGIMARSSTDDSENGNGKAAAKPTATAENGNGPAEGGDANVASSADNAEAAASDEETKRRLGAHRSQPWFHEQCTRARAVALLEREGRSCLGIQAVALYDFEASQSDELTFKEGDVITHIRKQYPEEWWWGRLGAQTGLLPSNYVEELTKEDLEGATARGAAARQRMDASGSCDGHFLVWPVSDDRQAGFNLSLIYRGLVYHCRIKVAPGPPPRFALAPRFQHERGRQQDEERFETLAELVDYYHTHGLSLRTGLTDGVEHVKLTKHVLDDGENDSGNDDLPPPLPPRAPNHAGRAHTTHSRRPRRGRPGRRDGRRRSEPPSGMRPRTSASASSLRSAQTRVRRSSRHEHHLMLVSRHFTAWRCDVCERLFTSRSTHGREPRFRCVAGCDYDLCDSCMARTAQISLTQNVHDLRGISVVDDADATATAAATAAAAAAGLGIAEHDDTRPGTCHSYVDEDGVRQYYRFAPDPADKDGDDEEEDEEDEDEDDEDDLYTVARPRNHRRLRLSAGDSVDMDLRFPGDGDDAAYAGVDVDEALEAVLRRGRRTGSTLDFEYLVRHHRQYLEQERRRASNRDGMDSVQRPDRNRREAAHLIMRPTEPRRGSRLTPSKAAKPVYEWRSCLGSFRLGFQRLDLTQMLDPPRRNWLSQLLVALLAGLCAVVGFELARLLDAPETVVLWVVVAGAQFSLLKSVQPDASSAALDDRAAALTRSVALCLIGGLTLLLDWGAARDAPYTALEVYGLPLHSRRAMAVARDVLLVVVVALPAIFALGNIATPPTLLHWLVEQLDMHVFGGRGSARLDTAALGCLKSAVVVTVVWAVAYAALADSLSVGGSHLFDLFLALVVALTQFVSRLPSDASLYASAFRRQRRREKGTAPTENTRSKAAGLEGKQQKRAVGAESAAGEAAGVELADLGGDARGNNGATEAEAAVTETIFGKADAQHCAEPSGVEAEDVGEADVSADPEEGDVVQELETTPQQNEVVESEVAEVSAEDPLQAADAEAEAGSGGEDEPREIRPEKAVGVAGAPVQGEPTAAATGGGIAGSSNHSESSLSLGELYGDYAKDEYLTIDPAGDLAVTAPAAHAKAEGEAEDEEAAADASAEDGASAAADASVEAVDLDDIAIGGVGGGVGGGEESEGVATAPGHTQATSAVTSGDLSDGVSAVMDQGDEHAIEEAEIPSAKRAAEEAPSATNDNDDDHDDEAAAAAAAAAAQHVESVEEEQAGREVWVDVVEEQQQERLRRRVVRELVELPIVAAAVLLLSLSGALHRWQPALSTALYTVVGASGFWLHYLLPHLRAVHPWRWLSRPVLKMSKDETLDGNDRTSAQAARWFETCAWWGGELERRVLYPLLVVSMLTRFAGEIGAKFGPAAGALLLALAGFKLLRLAAGQGRAVLYLAVVATVLFFECDFSVASEGLPVDLLLTTILIDRLQEFALKLQFLFTYNAPWNARNTWGSALHAFLYPFTLPHTAIVVVQAAVATLFSAPLYPLLGSPLFLVSYMRPVRFWEKDYRSKHLDESNTSEKSVYDSGVTANNLNSLFYEALLRQLRQQLAADVERGRFGPLAAGDVLVLTDNENKMTVLLHIVELGGGYVVFQMRGLEFVGTFCQAREVEALEEDYAESTGCCCSPERRGLPDGLLALNQAFDARWRSWQQVNPSYVVPGYSISLNKATTMFEMFDLRQVLVQQLTRSIIFYLLRADELRAWLALPEVQHALRPLDAAYQDHDRRFNKAVDMDFCWRRGGGVAMKSFFSIYGEWIAYCVQQRNQADQQAAEEGSSGGGGGAEPLSGQLASPVTRMCFAMALAVRRMIMHGRAGDTFLQRYADMFKGTLGPAKPRDGWVLADPALLQRVALPAVRMALRLHQDHFTDPTEYNDPQALFETLEDYLNPRSPLALVIQHETETRWRQAVLGRAPALLSLRYNIEDSSNNQEYFIVSLTMRYRALKVFKLNRESVRGLWASQVQEVLYLRSPANERGSIQNAKTVLRNMLGSSCDPPTGYPIFVSDIVTSYA